MLLVLILLLPSAVSAAGGDQEGCLFCHRLEIVRGGQEVHVSLRVWDPPGGVHDRLRCSDCHTDAREAPHSALPGPARCIGDCHGATPEASASHKRASFGGLTEFHRSVTAPAAPCRICHGAFDSRGGFGEIVARCVGCHPREGESLFRGIHARLPRGSVCGGCHTPHPEPEAAGKGISCDGSGCHASVTGRMIQLAAHDTSGPDSRGSGRFARTGLFLAIAMAGWWSGRRLSPSGRGKGAGE